MKKYQSFLHTFLCMERWQHKNTDTNLCQNSIAGLWGSADSIIVCFYSWNFMQCKEWDSLNRNPASTLLLSSGNAGSCCKGWYPCFCLRVILFYESAESVPTSLGPGTWGREIGSLYTGIHGFLSVKAAFRPEYSRYTWQMGKESFHGVSWFPSPYIYIA